jgi:signal peptidase I
MLEELSSEGSGPYRVFYFLRDKANQAGIDVRPFGPFAIPDHQYFVMGDNRDFSFDSRGYGTVPRELIWGKPTMVYWSSNSDMSHEEKTRWDRIGTGVK